MMEWGWRWTIGTCNGNLQKGCGMPWPVFAASETSTPAFFCVFLSDKSITYPLSSLWIVSCYVGHASLMLQVWLFFLPSHIYQLLVRMGNLSHPIGTLKTTQFFVCHSKATASLQTSLLRWFWKDMVQCRVGWTLTWTKMWRLFGPKKQLIKVMVHGGFLLRYPWQNLHVYAPRCFACLALNLDVCPILFL